MKDTPPIPVTAQRRMFSHTGMSDAASSSKSIVEKAKAMKQRNPPAKYQPGPLRIPGGTTSLRLSADRSTVIRLPFGCSASSS